MIPKIERPIPKAIMASSRVLKNGGSCGEVGGNLTKRKAKNVTEQPKRAKPAQRMDTIAAAMMEAGAFGGLPMNSLYSISETGGEAARLLCSRQENCA